jgi:hypothetical protein
MIFWGTKKQKAVVEPSFGFFSGAQIVEALESGAMKNIPQVGDVILKAPKKADLIQWLIQSIQGKGLKYQDKRWTHVILMLDQGQSIDSQIMRKQTVRKKMLMDILREDLTALYRFRRSTSPLTPSQRLGILSSANDLEGAAYNGVGALTRPLLPARRSQAFDIIPKKVDCAELAAAALAKGAQIFPFTHVKTVSPSPAAFAISPAFEDYDVL